MYGGAKLERSLTSRVVLSATSDTVHLHSVVQQANKIPQVPPQGCLVHASSPITVRELSLKHASVNKSKRDVMAATTCPCHHPAQGPQSSKMHMQALRWHQQKLATSKCYSKLQPQTHNYSELSTAARKYHTPCSPQTTHTLHHNPLTARQGQEMHADAQAHATRCQTTMHHTTMHHSKRASTSVVASLATSSSLLLRCNHLV